MSRQSLARQRIAGRSKEARRRGSGSGSAYNTQHERGMTTILGISAFHHGLAVAADGESVATAASEGAAVGDAVLPTWQRSFGSASFDFSEFMCVGWEVRAAVSSRDS